MAKKKDDSVDRLDALKGGASEKESDEERGIYSHYGMSRDDFVRLQEGTFFRFYSKTTGESFSAILDWLFKDESHEVRLKAHAYAISMVEFNALKQGLKVSGVTDDNKEINAHVMFVGARGGPGRDVDE